MHPYLIQMESQDTDRKFQENAVAHKETDRLIKQINKKMAS